MQRIIGLLALVLVVAKTAGAQPMIIHGVREVMDLTGKWGFRPDQLREGDANGWGDWKYDTGTWRQVQVPVTFDDCAPGMQGYRGVCWFQKKFTVPESWRGRRVGLRFEGVNNDAKVWVNGQLAGSHDVVYLPFELPVDGLLRYGQENLVVVRVSSDNTLLPPTWYWRADCGILREVRLIATDPCRVANVRVVAEPAVKGGAFSLRAFVENTEGKAMTGTLTVNITDERALAWFGKKSLARWVSKETALPARAVTEVMVSGNVPAAKPWSPESPSLYRAEIELRVGGRVIDRTSTRFGFRKIEVKGTSLLLNGRKLYLTGFNRHEDSPRTGMALDRETTRRDLEEMKAMGANFLRGAHYPHDPSEYDLCDELGILVMVEAPLNVWNGSKREGTLQACKSYLRRMIERDFNHPSVIFWSVGNECAENVEGVYNGIQELVAHAKTMDPTRLVTHVSNRWSNRDIFQFAFPMQDDVISINEYFAQLRMGSRSEGYDYAVIGKTFQDQVGRLHAILPDKPILITECGHASIEGCDGPQGEVDQARGMEAELSAHTMDYLCGSTIWCWAKHPWPRGAVYGYGCIFDQSPYGVVSRDRTHKHKGFYAAKKCFRELRRLHGFDPARPVNVRDGR
jgi:beta-galactosidase/beta-glucuronidase